MSEYENRPTKRKPLRKITPQRLKNIGLYYLERFESSTDNLRQVLQRRVSAYARENKDFDKQQAFEQIEDLIIEFQNLHYLDDERFARLKVEDYLSAGKPARYIKTKLKQKGIDEDMAEHILSEQEYDPCQMALKLAKRKKIGPFRTDDDARRENRQKDLGTLVRAGFDYDTAVEVIDSERPEDESVF